MTSSSIAIPADISSWSTPPAAPRMWRGCETTWTAPSSTTSVTRWRGQDMDDATDPYSCGLGWTVKLAKGDFTGASALRALDPKHPPRRFIGLRLEGRAIARHGNTVIARGRDAGVVTSGTFSFTLGYGIATASVDPELSPDTPLMIDIRGSLAPAVRVPLPFYRRTKGA